VRKSKLTAVTKAFKFGYKASRICEEYGISLDMLTAILVDYCGAKSRRNAAWLIQRREGASPVPWKRRQGEGGRIAVRRNSRLAKLTEAQIYEIREEWDAGLRGNDEALDGREVAETYGITRQHYSQIGRRVSWRSLPERESIDG
jgi:hypothetical protein